LDYIVKKENKKSI